MNWATHPKQPLDRPSSSSVRISVALSKPRLGAIKKLPSSSVTAGSSARGQAKTVHQVHLPRVPSSLWCVYLLQTGFWAGRELICRRTSNRVVLIGLCNPRWAITVNPEQQYTFYFLVLILNKTQNCIKTKVFSYLLPKTAAFETGIDVALICPRKKSCGETHIETSNK